MGERSMHPPGPVYRIRIQAQCVDLSIKLIPTQTNTHQSNSCCGPGLGVGGTGDYSRCMSKCSSESADTLSVNCQNACKQNCGTKRWWGKMTSHNNP